MPGEVHTKNEMQKAFSSIASDWYKQDEPEITESKIKVPNGKTVKMVTLKKGKAIANITPGFGGALRDATVEVRDGTVEVIKGDDERYNAILPLVPGWTGKDGKQVVTINGVEHNISYVMVVSPDLSQYQLQSVSGEVVG